MCSCACINVMHNMLGWGGGGGGVASVLRVNECQYWYVWSVYGSDTPLMHQKQYLTSGWSCWSFLYTFQGKGVCGEPASCDLGCKSSMALKHVRMIHHPVVQIQFHCPISKDNFTVLLSKGS